MADEPPFISNEELMEVVVRFAERRGDGCTWDCPAKHGRYCLDGHAEAYNAREILRARGISHRIPLPDPTQAPLSTPMTGEGAAVPSSDAIGPPSICGDCGAPIERHRGNWAKRVFGEHNGFDYCCRVTYELNGDRPMLLTADYHYVEGETQRHFPSYPEPQFPQAER